MDGRKKPRASSTLPSWKIRKVRFQRKLKSNGRMLDDWAIGNRGLTKYRRGAVRTKSTIDQTLRVTRKPWALSSHWRKTGRTTPDTPVPAC